MIVFNLYGTKNLLQIQVCDGSEGAFMILNVDCQLMIMEDLCLLDLINSSIVNKHLSSVGSDIFRRRFGGKVLKIHGNRSEEEAKISDMKDSLIITDLDVSLKLITAFSQVIPKIEIDFEFIPAARHNELMQHVNKFASNSVVEVSLKGCNGNLFQALNEPFVKIEAVQLGGKLTTLKSGSLEFNELFPALRRLDIRFLQIIDYESIEREFTHLENLSVVFLDEESVTEANINNLMKKNPQITFIGIQAITPAFMKVVSERLPKLVKIDCEFVTKEGAYAEDVEMHFKSVKEATIKGNAFFSPMKLSFDRLESLELRIFGGSTDDWVEFIARHSNLKTLKIHDGFVNDEQLTQIAHMQNFVDLNVGGTPELTVGAILHFMQNNQQLQKCYLRKLNKSMHAELRTALNQQWKVIPYISGRSTDVYFLKKN